MKYTEKIMNTVKGALAQVERIADQMGELKRQYGEERITRAVFEEQTAALNKKIAEIKLEAAKQIQEVGTAYAEIVKKNFVLDSSMIHDDAKLLQLDMKITPRQFEALVEKHRENPVMAQLLQEYSNKHEGLYPGYLPSVEGKTSAFDVFVGAAMDTVRTPDNLVAAMFQDGKYTPAICTESE